MAIRSNVGSRAPHRALIVFCVLVVGACQITRDPMAYEISDGPIAVHAMLIAGERSIAVLVTRYESTGAGVAFGRTHRIAPVADAEVRVSGAGQSITLWPNGAAESCIDQHGAALDEMTIPLAPGCYTGLPEDAIAAGALYELHVSLPNGTVVTGQAEVPRPSMIRTPEAGTELEVRWADDPDDPAAAPPHTVTWTDPGPNRALRLRLETDGCGAARTTHEPEPGELLEPLYFWWQRTAIDLTGRDSASVGGWYLSCNEQPPAELDGALQIAALDLAYAEYLDMLARAESIPLTDASFGLTGAVGVFAGTAITRQPVRLIVR